MSERKKPGIAATVVCAADCLWVGYSHLTAVADLPANASKLEKVMADPPAYLPWLIALVCIVIMGWAFWPRKEMPPSVMPSAIPPSASPSAPIPPFLAAPPTGPIGIAITNSNMAGSKITGNRFDFTTHTHVGKQPYQLTLNDMTEALRKVREQIGSLVRVCVTAANPASVAETEKLAAFLADTGLMVTVEIAQGRLIIAGDQTNQFDPVKVAALPFGKAPPTFLTVLVDVTL